MLRISHYACSARKLYEGGLYKKIHSEQLFLMKIIDGKPQPGRTVKAIHIDVMSILFEALSVFVALACLAFAMEIIIYWKIGPHI